MTKDAPIGHDTPQVEYDLQDNVDFPEFANTAALNSVPDREIIIDFMRIMPNAPVKGVGRIIMTQEGFMDFYHGLVQFVTNQQEPSTDIN